MHLDCELLIFLKALFFEKFWLFVDPSIWHMFLYCFLSRCAPAVPGWDVHSERYLGVLLCWNDRRSFPVVPRGSGAPCHPLFNSAHCLQVNRKSLYLSVQRVKPELPVHPSDTELVLSPGSWSESWSVWIISRSHLSSPTSHPVFTTHRRRGEEGGSHPMSLAQEWTTKGSPITQKWK